MLLYSTPPLPGCSCLHKVKGSNQAPSLFLYFLFNYSQAVQVLLYFPSPYATLSSCFCFVLFFFEFWTVPLASLPFLSPRCVPPALPGSAVFVTSAVHICWLSPPLLPPPAPPSVPSPRSSVFASGSVSQPATERFCHGRCSRFHAAGSSPATKGNPCCSPSAAQAETALQLLSNCWSAAAQGAMDGTAFTDPEPSGPLGCSPGLGGPAGALPTVLSNNKSRCKSLTAALRAVVAMSRAKQSPGLVSHCTSGKTLLWFVSWTHSIWSLSSVSGCNVLYSITYNHSLYVLHVLKRLPSPQLPPHPDCLMKCPETQVI